MQVFSKYTYGIVIYSIIRSNLFQRLTITKLALINQISARCKNLWQGAKSLNLHVHYNTYHGAYRILVPCYKCIANIEDFGQLMLVH